MTAQTRHLTILLTDIKGFTDKTSSRSRADIQRLLDEHRDAVLPVLQEKGGRLVKTIGDAFLMCFESPTDAVLAGVAAQEALARRNDGRPEADRIEIRVAINSGEVNLVEGDVFGEPVNIAARIEGVAEAGEVYFTEAVYLSMNKTEVPSSEVGLLQLKGIPEKVRVYKVRRETPLGVGRMPPASAQRTGEGGFAPGQKARFSAPAGAAAPAAFAPPPAAARPGGRPGARTRLVALAVDGLLCSMLVKSLLGLGGAATVKIEGGMRPAKVKTADGKWVRGNFTVGEGSRSVEIGKDGLRVTGEEGDKVVIGPSGVRVESEDGEKLSLPGPAGGRIEIERAKKRSLFPLGWLLYNFLFIWLLGATPGKKLKCLRVVGEDGSPVGWKAAALRSVMSVLSGSAMMLGYAWALWDTCGRTWHDAFAGTRVEAVPSA